MTNSKLRSVGLQFGFFKSAAAKLTREQLKKLVAKKELEEALQFGGAYGGGYGLTTGIGSYVRNVRSGNDRETALKDALKHALLNTIVGGGSATLGALGGTKLLNFLHDRAIAKAAEAASKNTTFKQRATDFASNEAKNLAEHLKTKGYGAQVESAVKAKDQVSEMAAKAKEALSGKFSGLGSTFGL